MSAEADATTIQALRADVALQLTRFLNRQQLNQAKAARLLRIPQPTISKIVNGRVSDLSLELLIRIAVRAGLRMTLQIGAAPEEAGAFAGNVRSQLAGARSKVAEGVRDAMLETVRKMSPEERLNAHLKHSQLVTAFHHAGRHSRAR
jgi:predicted XRE-type DNA-binding protein